MREKWKVLIPVFFSGAWCSLPAQESGLFTVSLHPLSTTWADEFGLSETEKGKLLFCSNRKPGFFKTIKLENGEYSPSLFEKLPGQAPAQLGSSRIIAGPANALGSGLVYTRTAGERLGLFFSPGVPLPDDSHFSWNHKDWSLAQPVLSAGGDILWFSSDKPGGFGGTDLYYSVKNNGEWLEPENAGPGVNSPSNEIFPSLRRGKLFFASNRNGSYDIFHFSATTSFPLPSPVNSEADEIHLWWKDDATAYLSSNRKGSFDLFVVRDNFPPCEVITKVEPVELCFTFFESSETGSDTLPLGYEWIIDGERFRGMEAAYCFPEPGTYPVSLNIIDTLTGETFFNQATYNHEIKVPFQVALSESANGLTVDPLFTNTGPYENHEVTLRSDQHWRSPAHAGDSLPAMFWVRASAPRGDTLMCFFQSVPMITPPVQNIQKPPADPYTARQPETEEPGEEIFRVKLFSSQEKAKREDERFSRLPEDLVPQEWYSGRDSLYTYTVGESRDKFSLYGIYRKAKESGFFEAEVDGFEPSKLVGMEDLENLENAENIVLRINNIYFSSGSFVIPEASKPVLDSLAAILLARPGLNVEISAHTDSEGREDFNQRLSEKRAEAVLNYLAGSGVVTTRMTSRGFGEGRPVSGNDTEEGKALNRRIEFRINAAAR